jgi:hypothetical protein
MGAWGLYDDENDNVADIWIQIEENTLPECFNEIIENIQDEYEAINTLRRAYAKNNSKKLYNVIDKWLFKFKRDINDEEDNPYMNISGIALKAARVLQELPSSDPLGTGIFDSLIPQNLPRGYPEWLRKEALNAVKIQLDELDENKQGWTDINKREKALEHELFYFSKGKEGKQGKYSKSNKSNNFKIRKGSRKMSRVGSRKGPSESATLFRVNTKKIGNDDNLWIVTKTINGVKRWAKINSRKGSKKYSK